MYQPLKMYIYIVHTGHIERYIIILVSGSQTKHKDPWYFTNQCNICYPNVKVAARNLSPNTSTSTYVPPYMFSRSPPTNTMYNVMRNATDFKAFKFDVFNLTIIWKNSVLSSFDKLCPIVCKIQILLKNNSTFWYRYVD